MVIWKRDVLIFGRDIAGSRSGQGNIANKWEGETGHHPPYCRFESCPTQLIEWFKITDRKTLHQTHKLLKALLACFVSLSGEPPHATIESLERYSERKKGT